MISNNPLPWCRFVISLIRQVSFGHSRENQDIFAATTAEFSKITRYWELWYSQIIFDNPTEIIKNAQPIFSHIKILLSAFFLL